MPIEVTWNQVRAWRMQRHLLDPIAGASPTEVVHRLCGVQTQVASAAELAVRLRMRESRPGEVGRALSAGRLIKTWAMRGALHLLTPEDAGAFLSLMAAGRSWERPSWQRYFGVGAAEMEELRRVVRQALDGAVLTREQLTAAVVAHRGLAHVGEGLASGWGTLLKPLAWQGELCFGPSQGNRATFVAPKLASSDWTGLLPVEEAAPLAVASYLAAYGPATFDNFASWLAGGWFGKRRVRSWFEALGDRVAHVDVEGDPAYLLAEHLDDVMAASPSSAVRLVPGFDQYVLGPGTADRHVVPLARRAAVSKPGGWISPLVIAGGEIRGIWELDDDRVQIGWFAEAGRIPQRAIKAEVARLSSILERPLEPNFTSL